MVGKERKILRLIKKEKVKTFNKSKFNNKNKIIKMECIVVYGLDSKELLLNSK